MLGERVEQLYGQARAYDKQRGFWRSLFGKNPYDDQAWQLLQTIHHVGLGIAAYNASVSADQRIDFATFDFRSVNTASLQRIGLSVDQISLVLASFGASEISAIGAEANTARGWVWGSNKGMEKTLRQMDQRGWTPNQITEAMQNGQSYPAQNLVNPGNSATRYVNPTTGRSVVIDDVTKEVIHVGGDGFKY